MLKTFYQVIPSLLTGGLAGAVFAGAVLTPLPIRAQSTSAAARALAAAAVDPGERLPSLPGAANAVVAAPLAVAIGEAGDSSALQPPALNASVLTVVEAASLSPFTGPPPPVECIPALIENSLSAFPPQSICQ